MSEFDYFFFFIECSFFSNFISFFLIILWTCVSLKFSIKKCKMFSIENTKTGAISITNAKKTWPEPANLFLIFLFQWNRATETGKINDSSCVWAYLNVLSLLFFVSSSWNTRDVYSHTENKLTFFSLLFSSLLCNVYSYTEWNYSIGIGTFSRSE